MSRTAGLKGTMFRAVVVASAAAFLSAAAFTPAPAEDAPRPIGCGGEAGRYELGKLTVWVLRRGTFERENPLRPLTPENLVALQVVVNGRNATAFGTDFAHLQQGAAAGDLERGGALRWAGADDLPAEFRVVSADGAPLFGPLRFVSCGEAPKVAAAAGPRVKPAKKARAGAGSDDKPPGPRLPQGALPGLDLSGGKERGLSLPAPRD